MSNTLNQTKSMKKIIIEIGKMPYLPKLSLKMKLTYFLLFLTLFQIQAHTYSQNVKVTLDCKDMKLEDVLREIEEKTAYKFLYEKDVFKKHKIVSIAANKEKLSTVLKTLFKSEGIDFKVSDKQIVLFPKVKADSLMESAVNTVGKLFQSYITGKITNTNGEPLAGATIIFKGTNKGVSSNFDGQYRIALIDQAKTLSVSYLGYETKDVDILDRTVINIQLSEAVTGLDETVVIGYGNIKRETLTGSVGTVDVLSIQNQGRILNIDAALQGQVAGVQVSSPNGRPGAAAKVRIRGSSSILGTNQPLYVIDGVPLSPSVEIPGFKDFIDFSTNNNTTDFENDGFNNDLGFLDFRNIESISVLKDASATAIYGSRGANGVIMISTKTGKKATKPQFELSTTQRVNISQKLNVLNSKQYQEIYKEAIENYQNSGGVIPNNDLFAQGILAGTEVDLGVDTDWQSLVGSGTSYTNDYRLAVRGATEKGSYFTSLSILNDKGAIKGDELTRYSLGLSLKQELKDNLKFFSNLSLGLVESEAVLGGFFSASQAATTIRPDKTPFDDEGNLLEKIGDIYNPVSLKENKITSSTFSILGSMGLEYEPIKNLVFKSMGILHFIDGENYSFYPSFTTAGLSKNGRGGLINTRTIDPSVETTITYNFSAGKHNANFLAGNTFQKNSSKTYNTYGENFPNDDTLTGISYAGENLSVQEAITKSTLISFFSRLQYDYDKKYLLSLSARADGSSKFGANERWSYFPSVGLGWNIHRENFVKEVSWLSNLKIRASFGQTGNVTFDPNQSFSLFGALNGNTGIYNGDTGVVPLRIGNPELKWEITTQKDFGLDFGFLNDAIAGEFGYYIKETKDVLFQTTLPSSSGLGTVIANLGDTENKGFELTLNFRIVDNKDFKWNMMFNAATASSKVKRLNSSYKDDLGRIYLGGVYLIENEPLGLIRGFVAEGIFKTQDEIDALNSSSPSGVYQHSDTGPGDIKYADLNGDGFVNASVGSGEDVTSIGNVEPDFFGGINSNFSYKGLSLNIFANYSVGNDIYWKAGEETFSFTSTNDQANKLVDVFNRWTPNNPNAKYPRVSYRNNLGGANRNNRRSSLYINKGDYLRIKAVTLSYSLPRDVLKNINIQDMSIFVTGTDLFTFTKYPGANPEFANVSSLRSPLDRNRYPVAKQVTAGVRLTF